jgi:hypothetical protein
VAARAPDKVALTVCAAVLVMKSLSNPVSAERSIALIVVAGDVLSIV